MPNIDYNAYLTMDTKELDKIVGHVKNILHLRDEALTQALSLHDLPALQTALEHNKRQILSDKNWKALSFNLMAFEDIAFFEYVRELPKFKDNEYRRDSKIFPTLTHEAMGGAMSDKRVLDYFYDHPELKSEFLKQVEIMLPLSHLTDDMIVAFIEKKLVSISPEFIGISLNNNCYEYLGYGLKNNLLNFSQTILTDIYIKCAFRMPVDIMKNLYACIEKPNTVSLQSLIENIAYSGSGNAEYECYKSFVKTSSETLSFMLNAHESSEHDIERISTVLINTFPATTDKLVEISEILYHQDSDAFDTLKGFIMGSSKGGKNKLIQNVFMNFDLQKNLPEKAPESSKMKI